MIPKIFKRKLNLTIQMLIFLWCNHFWPINHRPQRYFLLPCHMVNDGVCILNISISYPLANWENPGYCNGFCRFIWAQSLKSIGTSVKFFFNHKNSLPYAHLYISWFVYLLTPRFILKSGLYYRQFMDQKQKFFIF